MAAYEVLAQQHNITLSGDETIISNFITYKPKKSFRPTYKIKQILKSVRKFFKKPKESPIQYNGDASILEFLPNEHHQEPTVEISFFSDEEHDNMENERLEAQMMANQ